MFCVENSAEVILHNSALKSDHVGKKILRNIPFTKMRKYSWQRHHLAVTGQMS
jgi:hypothetical protein